MTSPDFRFLCSHTETTKKKPPPRLFCDICDCFDLHDTEDCPTQDQMLDSPPHTTYHGSPHDERPYCDICEAFGHWTDSCNDDQTFQSYTRNTEHALNRTVHKRQRTCLFSSHPVQASIFGHFKSQHLEFNPRQFLPASVAQNDCQEVVFKGVVHTQ